MKTCSIRALLLLCGLAAGCRAAHADPAGKSAPSASAYGSAPPSPSDLPPDEEPPPVASGARQPHRPNLDAPPPPEVESPKPTTAEWSEAPEADDVRITDPGCKAWRLREWYRVVCRDTEVSVVTGTKKDLSIHASEQSAETTVIFPARRGDRRLLVFAFPWKWGLIQDAILSEQWLEGDPRPLITVTGIPHGV